MSSTLPAVGVPGETGPVEPEVVSPMKPSVALRLGRLVRPRRTFGGLSHGTDGACALGAIAAAVGGALDYAWIAERFPELGERWLIGCPVAGCDGPPIFGHQLMVLSMVWHLNDPPHVWSDDQIVAWLQGMGL